MSGGDSVRRYELHKAFPLQYLLILIVAYYISSTGNLQLSVNPRHPAFIFVFFWSGLAIVSAVELYYATLKIKTRNDYWVLVIIGIMITLVANLIFLGVTRCEVNAIIIGLFGVFIMMLPGVIVHRSLSESIRTRMINVQMFIALIVLPAVVLYLLIK